MRAEFFELIVQPQPGFPLDKDFITQQLTARSWADAVATFAAKDRASGVGSYTGKGLPASMYVDGIVKP
jgi:hypothetical protein